MIARKILSQRASGLCGILAPIIGLSCIAFAVLLCPWFSWTENYLSDLGGFPGDNPIWAAHGAASILFNAGLIIAGMLGIFFGFGLRKSQMFTTSMGNVGTLFIILDSAALVGIGIFPETTGSPHTFFSIAFFILVGVALIFMGITLIKSSERKLGWLTIVLFIFGLVSVPLFITPKPVGSNAIAEMIPIISISIFSMVFGYRLFGLNQINGSTDIDERKGDDH